MPNKPLVAHQSMKEFDPECERHFPIMIIKAVEPGCTTELQIEFPLDGTIIRMTTTESETNDMANFTKAVHEGFIKAMIQYDTKVYRKS